MQKIAGVNLSKQFQAGIIGLLAFLSYANTVQHNFVLDDDILVLQNRFVQEGMSSLPEIFSHGYLYGFNQKNDQSYRPVPLAVAAVINTLFGNSPKAYHLLNILAYVLCCLLLFIWLSRCFEMQFPSLPFWASLLFVLHPIHTEVVANVKSLDELLHFIFAVSSLIYWSKYLEKKESKSLFFSLLFFALAMLSKEIGLSLLLILPLTAFTFQKLDLKSSLKLSWPFVAIAVGYFLLRSAVLESLTFEEDMKVINNALAGADTYAEQLATTFYIFSEYVKLLFFPHPLSWDYSVPYFELVDFTNARVLLTVSILLLATIFAIKEFGKRSYYSYLFFFFCAAFALSSNFIVLIGATLGERLLFFPSIAWAVLIPYALFKLVEKQHFMKMAYFNLILGIISILFFAKTIDRNKDWKDNEALFISGVEATPNNARAQSALASVYRVRGEQTNQIIQKQEYLNEAARLYEKSLALYNENSNAWYNLGVTLMGLKHQASAQKAFEKAIEYSPDHLNALNNLGVIYFRSSELQKAEYYFSECVRVNPNFQSAYANLGAVYHNFGDYQQAAKYYQKALSLNPNDLTSRKNLQQLQSDMQ
ncbi:MAG: tetratricopeptide repeat protein [Vicingaceae bacterium]